MEGGPDGRDLLDSFDEAAGSSCEHLGCRSPLSSRVGSALFFFISSTPSAGPHTQEGLNECDGTYRLIANQYRFYFSVFDYTGLQMNCTFK